MRLRDRLVARRRAVASCTAVAVTAAGVLVAIMTADGFPAADVNLNDAGIWVTKSDALLLGRFNRQVDQLDASVGIPSHDYDVLQNDATVLVTDREGGKLLSVGAAYVNAQGQTDLASDSQVALGGGISALASAKSGAVWVRAGGGVVAVKPDDPPTFTVGSGAVVAVGVDGAVHAVSVSTGRLADLAPADPASGSSGAPVLSTLNGARNAAGLSLTAVGPVPVALDGAGRLLRPGQAPLDLSRYGTHAVLQQPGPAADTVIVATDTALLAVPLGHGTATVLGDGAGAPAAPVRLGDCVHAAWSTTPTYARSCGDQAAAQVRRIPGLQGPASLTFRVNRGQIVLNDLVTGAVWLVDDLRQVADWQTVRPREQQQVDEEKEESEDQPQDRHRSPTNHPPVAKDDTAGARPGQSATLRLLENDTDPDGDVLALDAVPRLDAAQGRLDLIQNGQALQFTPAAGVQGDVTFTYSVGDGRGGHDTAQVTVHIRPQDQNTKPRLKPGHDSVVQVELGRSVDYDVLADWEDPDGDPLVLTAVSTGTADTVRYTAAGLVTYRDAGVQQGRKKIDVTVSDGHGGDVAGKLTVSVKPHGNLPPVTRDDLFLARAGQPTTLRPLLNDIDANGDPLLLMQVSSPAGASARIDTADNTVRFEADRAGTYLLDYKITDGQKVSAGLIRVDVRAAEGNSPPVAVADAVTVTEGSAAVVDVLANDLDLDGDVLVVRGVSTPPSAAVRLSVLDLHVVRVEAERPLPTPVTVTYEVTDGLATSEGSIVVRTAQGASANQAPLVKDDAAVVRAGDILSVPVLANDSDPDGDKISLDPDLTVPKGSAGLLFADGDVLRYQAPDRPTTVTAVYTAVDARGSRSSGQVTINVRPRDDKRNSPPTPPAVEARAFAGSTIRIKIPLLGTDPDGDSVTVVGPATAPHLGRVTGIEDGTTLVYQAFDTSAGTDSFTYAVTDAVGAKATGTVRIGVARRPDVDQPPVATADRLRVRPGKEIAAAVLANDSDPDGDPIGFDPDQGLSTTPSDVDARPLGDRIAMTLPDSAGTISTAYAITDGRGGRDSTFLTVDVDPQAPALPPVARDDVVPDLSTAHAQGTDTVVEVDVRKNDDDPDGLREDLKVSLVGPNATAGSVTAAGKVVVRLAPEAQSVAYQVTDIDGQSATAFVLVPGLSNQPPRLRDPHKTLKAESGRPLVIDLSDVVVDPEGHHVRLTRADAVSATSADGTDLVKDKDTVVFTSAQGYVGPAAITFEVTDGSGPDDPDGKTAIITLPIDVTSGANHPPTFEGGTLRVAPGEPAISVDLREFVHDPDAGDRGKHTFSSPTGAPAGLRVQLKGSRLAVSADAGVPKGTTARLGLTVTDAAGASVAGVVTVQVTRSTRPLAKANDDVVEDADQGHPVTVDVLANDANPFPGKPLKLVSATVVAGAGSSVLKGDSVVFTSGDDFYGTARLSYVVADATGDPDRQVTGRVTISVRGKPGQPAAGPTLTDSGDGFVTVRLNAPPDNGAPITRYDVSGSSGYTTTCANDLCRLDGLRNGTAYQFRYRAVNDVGAGPWSEPSAEVTPDIVPDAPDAPTAQAVNGGEGRQITLTWRAPTNRGTAIQKYVIEMSPPGASGSQVESSGTSMVVSGLTNGTPYTFTVRAVNAKGEGPASASSAPEVPAGVPGTPSAPSATNSGGSLGGQLDVRWTEPATNGAVISKYTLRVFKNGSLVQTLSPTTASQTISADNASDYTFDLSATNKSGTSPVSARSSSVRVFGAPYRVGTVTATPGDRQATLSFSAPNDNGKTITGYDYRVNGGSWSSLPSNRVIGGLNNGTGYSFQVRACNDYCGEASASSSTVTPYGQLSAPSVSTSNPSGNTVKFSWSAPPANGRGVARTEYSIGGGSWQSAGASGGSWTSPSGYNKTYSIRVRAVDNGGLAGSEASSSNSTATSTISVVRGALHKNGTTCTDDSCGYVRVTLTNFDPGTYTAQIVAPYDGYPPGGTYSISIGSSGTGVGDRIWLYGYPGKQVWATVGSFTAPKYTWPN